MEDIKKYCKEDSLTNITNYSFMRKRRFKESLINDEYNFKVNIKEEELLNNGSKLVWYFKNNFSDKPKSFRFMKRLSYVSPDKLFRIDLSGVKTNVFKNGKYVLSKTFKESNILSNPENYELEIEFIGSNPDNIEGNQILKNLYTSKLHKIPSKKFIIQCI